MAAAPDSRPTSGQNDLSWGDVFQGVAAVAAVIGAVIAAIVALYGIKQGRTFQRERAEERRREWLENRLAHLTQTSEKLLQLEHSARTRDATDVERWQFRLEGDARALQGDLGDVLFSLSKLTLDLTAREFPQVRAAMDQVQEETSLAPVISKLPAPAHPSLAPASQ